MSTDNDHQLAARLFKQSYNRYASQYAAAAFLPKLIADRLFNRLQFIKIAPKTILDLGAGNIEQSILLQQIYPDANILAIDISSEMLKQAPQTMTSKSIFRVAADAIQLPLSEHSIDFVFSNLLLPCLLDYSALWQELIRILKPGGLLLFSSLGPDTLTELRQSFAQCDNNPHVNIFLDMHDIGDSLLQAGFQDPVMDVERYTVTYSNLRQLLHELKSLGSTKLVLDSNEQYYGKHYWQILENVYLKQYGLQDKDKRLRLTASAEIIFGHAFAPLCKKNIPGEISIRINEIRKTDR